MIAGCRRIFAQRRTRAPGARRKLIGAHRGALGSLKRRLSGTEDPEGARVAVKKGLALNRPDLAVAEEPGERHLAQMPMKRVAVVIRLAIQMAPAAEAREEQCSRRRLLPVEVGAIAPQPLIQILRGRACVAQVELHDLSIVEKGGHDHRAAVWIHPH